MKKTGLLLGLSILTLFVYSQGIEFQDRFSWKEVQEKAKQERKFIFVDCYATWCGPCKKMDKEVYPDKKVGDFVNTHFISVKVQTDQAKTDNDLIRSSYADAKEFREKNNITELPTFLFFDSEGKLVHREVGYYDTVAFLNICVTALDPIKNFNGLVEQYKAGKIKGARLLELALAAKKYKNDSLAQRIITKYKTSVLDGQSLPKLLTLEQLDIIQSFPQLYTINDTLIGYIYSHQTLADQGFKQEGMALRIVDYMIGRDIINPLIKTTNNAPTTSDWQKIHRKIAIRFDAKTAYRNILYAKLDWYQQKRDWDNFAKTWIEKIDSLGIDMKSVMGGVEVNNTIYDIIFKHVTDPYVLKKAAQYMEALVRVSQGSAGRLDTYANVLYKNGQKEKALTIEKQALSIAEKSNNQGDPTSIELYKETIAKMEKGQPTWVK